MYFFIPIIAESLKKNETAHSSLTILIDRFL